MKYLLFVFVCSLTLLSCEITENIKRSKAENYYRSNPEEFARLAADKYPPTNTTIRVDTFYISAKVDSSYDYIMELAQDWIQRTQEKTYEDTTALATSYRIEISNAARIIKELSERHIAPDTVRELRTVSILDTKMLAANESLLNENKSLKSEVFDLTESKKAWQQKAKKRNTTLIIISSIIGLSFVGWLVSKFKTINIKK